MYRYSLIILASISMHGYNMIDNERVYGVMRYFKDKYKFEKNIKDLTDWGFGPKIYLMILTKKKFSTSIEQLVIDKRCSYIDAIVIFCQDNHLEPDSVKGLVTPPLKEKIKAEAVGLKMVKDSGSKAKLPI